MSAWLFGNTTVRSPFRLKDGLFVLKNANLEGRIRGSKNNELLFCKALVDYQIITANFDQEQNFTDATYSVGRKWRSALEKLKFIQDDYITVNGERLLQANTVPAMQECFLRALIPYTINIDGYYFSPFIFTLQIMVALEDRGLGSHINFIEMAAIIQVSNVLNEIDDIVEQIIKLRQQRSIASNKKKFDREKLTEIVQNIGLTAWGTLKDYADTNIRYLKATGLFHAKGRGIIFITEKHLMIKKIISYYENVDFSQFDAMQGVPLPTDQLEDTLQIIQNIQTILKQQKIVFESTGLALNCIENASIERLHLEQILFSQHEQQYAVQQAQQWQEIAAYMQMLITGRSSLSHAEQELTIPKGEAPAYFEWILWRAFLAFNHLVIQPSECRRFKIDQDFLPVGTATGGGSDLIFEYKNLKIVGEVTLTTNSRQEAAEGEPVRRHVADIVLNSEKPVVGLFLANKIDTNTAETFRMGTWYTKDDIKIQLNIVPVTLSAFRSFFIQCFESNQNFSLDILQQKFQQVFICRMDLEAPQWKHHIQEVFEQPDIS